MAVIIHNIKYPKQLYIHKIIIIIVEMFYMSFFYNIIYT